MINNMALISYFLSQHLTTLLPNSSYKLIKKKNNPFPLLILQCLSHCTGNPLRIEPCVLLTAASSMASTVPSTHRQMPSGYVMNECIFFLSWNLGTLVNSFRVHPARELFLLGLPATSLTNTGQSLSPLGPQSITYTSALQCQIHRIVTGFKALAPQKTVSFLNSQPLPSLPCSHHPLFLTMMLLTPRETICFSQLYLYPELTGVGSEEAQQRQ